MNNKITITEMMNAAKTLKNNGEKFTLLGIGPMSKPLLKATLPKLPKNLQRSPKTATILFSQETVIVTHSLSITECLRR